MPVAPTGLSATASGSSTIDLSWTAPADNGGTAITGYRIEVSSSGTSSSWSDLVANTNNTTTTYSHTGVSAGTTHYRVSAINSVGTGTASGTARATATTVPGAPTGLMATASGTTTIDLDWTQPSHDGHAAITGYRIEVSPNGTSSSWSDLVANTTNTTTTYSHTGLSAATTRHYRVSAINANGTGAASSTANATTDAAAAPTVPGAPTGLSATASGTSTIDLSWTEPDDNGDASISGYKIEVSSNSGTSWTDLVANTNNTTTTYSHTGLTPSTTRHYRVSAINSVGTGAASNVDDATTAAATTTSSDATLSALTVNDGTTEHTIDLATTPYTVNVRNAVTTVTLTATPTHTGASVSAVTLGGTAIIDTDFTDGITVPSLAEGDNEIIVTVTAEDGTTTQPYPVTVTVTRAATVPGAPTGLSATANGSTQIDLSWTAPSSDGGASISGYKIEVSSNDTSSWTDLVANNTTTTYSHTGLTPSTTRHYRVSAINSVGTGAASNVDDATTAAATTTSSDATLSALTVNDGTTEHTIDLATTPYTVNVRNAVTTVTLTATPTHTGASVSAVTLGGTAIIDTDFTDGITVPSLAEGDNEIIVTVTAEDGTTTQPYPVTVTVTRAATVPGAPTGLSATANGSTQIDLSWTAPSSDGGASISGYKIEVSPNDTSSWTDLVANNTSTTYSHTGLTAGTTRHYRVSAINSVGTGAASSTANATTTSSDATLSALTVNDGTTEHTIDLATTPYTVNVRNAVTTVTLTATPTHTGASVSAVTLGGTAIIDTDFTDGITVPSLAEGDNEIVVTVTAEDGTTTQPYPVTVTVTRAATVPGAPTGLSATANGSTQIDLSWTAPSSDGGASISGYKIEVSPNDTSSWTDLVANNTSTTYSHTGLTAGTTRHYRVSAINSVGTGAASSTANATTTSSDATLSALTVNDGTTEHTIDLATTPYTVNVRNAVTTVTLTATPTHTGASVSAVTLGGTAIIDTDFTDGITVPSLAEGDNEIVVTVTAEDGTTTQPYPVTVTVTRAATVPGAPTGLSATANGSTQIDLSWTAPSSDGGASISGYKIEVSPNDTSSWTDLVANNTSTTYSHTGLTAGTTRHYRVSAINSVGTGAASSTANATTTSSDATLSALTVNDGTTEHTIDLATTPYTVNVRNAVTTVTLTATPTHTGASVSAVTLGGTAITDTDFTDGITVPSLAEGDNEIVVTVTAEDGTTTQPYPVTVTVTRAATVPGAPTGLSATASGTTTINLAWTAPTDDGGASITGYRIEVSPNGTSSWTDLVANNTTTTYSHTGLTAGTTRHYRVSAINSVGTGTASSTANATAATVPGAPTGLTATASGSTRINLTWTAPSDGGSVITGYKIEVSSNDGTSWSNREANTNSTSTSYAHTGLSAGTTRYYRVSAINSAGTGAASSTANATTGTDTGPLVLTVRAVSATVTDGEPVRYRILMSRPTSGALVESEYSYEGEFVRNGPASVVTGVSSQNGMTYWEIGYETLDDAMVEEDGSFTVRIQKPDAYLYNQGEAYTVGTPSSATVTILDNDPEEPPTLPIVSVFDVRVDEGPGRGACVPGEAQCGSGGDGDDRVGDAQWQREGRAGLRGGVGDAGVLARGEGEDGPRGSHRRHPSRGNRGDAADAAGRARRGGR